MEEMANQLQGLFQNLGQNQKKKRKIKVKEAMKALIEEEAARLVNPEELKQKAIASVENNGIVFLDGSTRSASAARARARTFPVKGFSATCCRWSRAAPSTPSTAWSRPITSCLSPPAPSRSLAVRPHPRAAGPSRRSGSADRPDHRRLRAHPDRAERLLIRSVQGADGHRRGQHQVHQDGIRRLAEAAWQVNERTENIGARRLHTVMERLMEDISL